MPANMPTTATSAKETNTPGTRHRAARAATGIEATTMAPVNADSKASIPAMLSHETVGLAAPAAVNPTVAAAIPTSTGRAHREPATGPMSGVKTSAGTAERRSHAASTTKEWRAAVPARRWCVGGETQGDGARG